mgnify:CR=1 FL=1
MPLLYVNDPSPPASVTLIAAVASASVYCVIVVLIAPLEIAIPVLALK